MTMTDDQKRARRRVIAKRWAVRKQKATWQRKKAAGIPHPGGRRRKTLVVDDDTMDLPAEDVLAELPDSLVG